jgi:hypothetical protein
MCAAQTLLFTFNFPNKISNSNLAVVHELLFKALLSEFRYFLSKAVLYMLQIFLGHPIYKENFSCWKSL